MKSLDLGRTSGRQSKILGEKKIPARGRRKKRAKEEEERDGRSMQRSAGYFVHAN
jgi:hypothetical protein